MSLKNSSPAPNIKTYILDTNVLLHDPMSIFKFHDNIVVIPVEVLAELDNKKTAQGELGHNARMVQRSLRALFGDKPIGENYKMEAATKDGGMIQVVVNEWLIQNQFPEGLKKLKATVVDMHVPDNRILASALYVKNHTQHPTILVTKDVNMALKGQALGFDVEDFKNDRITVRENESYQEIELSSKQWERLSTMDSDIRKIENYLYGIKFRANLGKNLFPGEYVIARVKGIPGYVEPLRYLGDRTFRSLPIFSAYARGNQSDGSPKGLQMPGGIHVTPRNTEQWTLMDAILDPATPLITVKAQAGTGKTFIAVATAIHEIYSEHTHYEKLFITRPNVDMGNAIGFLPGDQDDKMKPYMQPYYDNLDILFPTQKKPQKKHKDGSNGQAPAPMKAWEKFKQMGILEIQPLNTIRGRSLPNCLILVDESQNLTPIHAKTIATRIGEGAKVVFMGDPAQIDTPYLDAQSNGLVYLRERMRGQVITSHIKLVEGVRSEIAKLCAEML